MNNKTIKNTALKKVALIVDDSKLAQFVLRKMLLEHDLVVDSVESAEEAMDYLIAKKPDVIFMDHTMPGMDGLQAVKEIKENPDTASIPIMMYTSKSDGVFVNQARKLGAIEVLPKELKSIELEQVLNKLDLTDSNAPVTTIDRSEKPATSDAIYGQSNDKVIDVDSVDDLDEVSRLVKDAEAAFEKETLRQFVQQEFNKQEGLIEERFDYISQNLDYLRDNNSDKVSAQRFNFNNLFWPLFAIFALGFMGFMYYQQSQAIEKIRSTYQESLSSINKTILSSGNNVTSSPVKNESASRSVKASTKEIVTAIGLGVNSYNTVAYDDVYLGEAIIEKLESMLVPLSRAGFFGEIEISVHSGNFCLSSNSAGNLVLPKQEASLGECQVFEPVLEGERLSTEVFQDLIEGINDAENGLKVSVVVLGDSQPINDYPNGDNVSAAEWNRAAQKNNRVEFTFRSFEN